MALHISGSANEVWLDAARQLLECSKEEEKQASRCGTTYEITHVLLTIKADSSPWVFTRQPPINIAFALADFIWIINGRNDAKFINSFNSQYPLYAGYLNSYHGAYGKRLVSTFGVNQLSTIYDSLKHNRAGRQNVIQFWSPYDDLPRDNGKPKSSDIPCVVSAMLKARNGKLLWSQIFRSNDLFRGLPYDLLIGMLLQRMYSVWLDLDVDEYSHYCDSLHFYCNEENFIKKSIEFNHSVNDESDTLLKNLAFPDHDTTILIARFIAEFVDEVIKDRLSEISFVKKIEKRRGLIISYSREKSQKKSPGFLLDVFYILVAELLTRNDLKSRAHEYSLEVKTPAIRQLWTLWHERSKK